MEEIKKDSKMRSAVKSIIWRIVGVIVLAGVTYFYTQNWITTGLVTVIHHGTFLFVFYFHERIWFKFKKPTGIKRRVFKMFTYETLCGNIILGVITYLITRSWKAMTAITLTYIGIKHVIYVFNEFIWERKK